MRTVKWLHLSDLHLNTPGNHDVDRGSETAGDASRHEAIQRIFFHGRGYYRSDTGMIEPGDLCVLNQKQEDFRRYIANVFSDERISLYSDPLHPHFNIETEYLNILHVDSTMVYDSDQENNLIVGMNLLYEAVKTINRNKPTVLLTHYAYTSLAQEERKNIRELLYHNGIQLWLAGHEHEHNLQPINYLHSIQTGELRLEDKCNTSVLVGEMNTETGAGTIKAYAWFQEGWYKYPAVWHGVGKTTRLLYTCELLSNKAAVYFPLESSRPENLLRDLCRAVFSDYDEERLFQYAKTRHAEPDLFLFLDGMNEIDGRLEKDFVNVIRKISREYPGIQLVITSRSNFMERYPLERFTIGRLHPLRPEQIKTLFTENEWRQIWANPPLMQLIKNPLMATLYKHILPEMGSEKEYIDWIEEITNETELIYDYYLSQLSLYFGKQEQDQLIYVAQYIRRCLPYIAYQFESRTRHTMPIAEFRNLFPI